MTRLGQIGLGVLVCLLGIGATASRAADPKVLPSDTEIVFTVNVKQIFASDLVKKNKDTVEQVKAMIEQALPADNPATKYLKAMGFDPFKDLHSVTLALGATTNPEAGFLLIEGNFDTDKFHDTAEAAAKDNSDAVKVSKVGANRVVELTPPGDNARLFASLVGKETLIVAGSKAGLTDALARVAGTKRNSLKKEFRSLLETTNSKQSVSFVATGSAVAKLLDELPVPENNRKQVESAITMLKQIEGFSAAITLAKDIQFQLGVNSKDNDTAKNMAQQAQKALAGLQFILQLQAGNDAKFGPLVDIAKTLKINSQGSNLVIQGQVTPEVIGELLKNLPNMQ
jgi:hypothetical protein